MSNALRNSKVFDGLDREIDEFLKDFRFFWETLLNALRNSNDFGGSDRQIEEFLRNFDSCWEYNMRMLHWIQRFSIIWIQKSMKFLGIPW